MLLRDFQWIDSTIIFALEEANYIICKNEYKKKKLFYILMDGISYDNFMNYLKKINII